MYTTENQEKEIVMLDAELSEKFKIGFTFNDVNTVVEMSSSRPPEEMEEQDHKLLKEALYKQLGKPVERVLVCIQGGKQ